MNPSTGHMGRIIVAGGFWFVGLAQFLPIKRCRRAGEEGGGFVMTWNEWIEGFLV